MAIQERKVQKTGGGSSATGVGVQQLAVPEEQVFSGAQKLAKALGVAMDATKLSPHEQMKVDMASSAEYQKLQKDLVGKSETEQGRLRAEHRAKFTESNPNTMVNNLLGRSNPKLQGYDTATAKSLHYQSTDAISQLHKGFEPQHDREYRTQALLTMYDTQLQRANDMSPEVAEQWLAMTTESYEKAYTKVRNDSAEIEKAEAVKTVTTATEGELTHLIEGVDLIEGKRTLQGYEDVARSVNTISDDGTEVLDPKVVKQMFGSIQAMRAGIKEQDGTMAKDQLNALVMEKYKWVSQMYNKPELFDALMDEPNGSGKTARELYPEYAQKTGEALYSESDKKYQGLVSKHEGQQAQVSAEIRDAQLLEFEELTSRADGGDLDAIEEAQNATSKAFGIIQNNEGMSATDKMSILKRARTTEIINRNYVAGLDTERMTQSVIEASTDLGRIKDYDLFVHNHAGATPESLKLFKARWDKQEDEFKDLTKTQEELVRARKASIRSAPTRELAVEFETVKNNLSASLDMQSEYMKVYDNLATPTGQRLMTEATDQWLKDLHLSGAVTGDEQKEFLDQWLNTEIPKYIKTYETQMNSHIQKVEQLGVTTPDATESEPVGPESKQLAKEVEEFLADDPNRPKVTPSKAKQSLGSIGESKGAEEHKTSVLRDEQEVKLRKFKKESPDKYFYELLPKSGKQGLERMVKELPDRIEGLIQKDKPNVLDVMSTLLSDMKEHNPKLLEGQPKEVLQDLAGVIAEVTKRLPVDDPRVKNYHEEAFGLDAFDRDGKLNITPADIIPVIEGTLLQGRVSEADGSGLYESGEILRSLLEELSVE